MKNKKNKKPEQKLTYEFVGVSRWNICQQIASMLYHSSVTDDNLKKQAIELSEEIQKLNK